MVYDPCPEGFKLVGGVCVPMTNDALMRWKSKSRKKGSLPPDPDPPPIPPPQPPPPNPPNPDNGGGGGGGSKEFDLIGANKRLTEEEVLALGLSAGASTAGLYAAYRIGKAYIYQSSTGQVAIARDGTITTAEEGEFEMTEQMSVFSEDAITETSFLLGRDEAGNPVVRTGSERTASEATGEGDSLLADDTAPVPDAGGEGGIEMQGGCNTRGRRLLGGIDVSCDQDEEKEGDADGDGDIDLDGDVDLDNPDMEQAIEDALRDNPELNEEQILAGLSSGDLDAIFVGGGETIAITGLALYITKLATDEKTRQDTIDAGDDIGLDPNKDVDIDKIPSDTNKLIEDTTGVDPYEIIPNLPSNIADAAEATGDFIVDAAETTGDAIVDIGKDIGKAINPFNW